MASDNPPMGANLDLQNGRIFRTTDGLKGSFTLGTATVVAGKFRIFDVGGQMAVIAPGHAPADRVADHAAAWGSLLWLATR